MMKLRLRTAAAVMLAGLLLAGCDQKNDNAKHIKVGVINGAEQDVAEVAKAAETIFNGGAVPGW